MLNIDKKKVITPDPETLMVKGFKDIWDKDKSENKEHALKVFAYIYFKYNPKSPYRKSSVGEDLQERLVHDIIQKKTWTIPKYVKVAEQIYEESMNSVAMKLVNAGLVAAEGVASDLEEFRTTLSTMSDPIKKMEATSKYLDVLTKIDGVVFKLTAAQRKAEEDFISEKSRKKAITQFEKPKHKR